MSSQEKWITSGASRLKAMQNRGFTYRAKQKASSMATHIIYKKREGGGRSHCQPSKRPKIVVGETAAPQIFCDPYDYEFNADNPARDNITRKTVHLHGERGNRRIREVPSGVQPRQQVMAVEGSVPATFSAGPFGDAVMSHGRNSYSHPEGIVPAGSNVSLLSDASAFADQEQIQLTRDSITNYDLSADRLENPFLSRGIGTPRHTFVPSDLRRGAIDALDRGFGSPGLSIGTNMAAYGLEPSSGNGVLLREMLQEGSDFPRDRCFASRQYDLSDGVTNDGGHYKLNSPVQNAEAGGSTDPADFIRRLLAAQSGSVKLDASTHGQGEQRDRMEKVSNFLIENEDSAPYYIINVGEKESASPQTEGTSAGDEVTKKRAPPIRFFDAGMEISVYGRPLSRKRKGETPKRWPRSPNHDMDQANTEGDEALRNLQEHQRSIWDQFVPKTREHQAALPSETQIQCKPREHDD